MLLINVLTCLLNYFNVITFFNSFHIIFAIEIMFYLTEPRYMRLHTNYITYKSISYMMVFIKMQNFKYLE